MKSFSLLRIWAMLVVAIGAMLVFAPASRAQAEVAPDHYDEAQVASPLARQTQPKAGAAVRNGAASKEKETTAQTPVAGHNSLVSQKREAAATEPKRQP